MRNTLVFRACLIGGLAILLAPTAWSRSLELSTEDGVRLHASIDGRGVHGVLLIHGRDRSGLSWKLFVEKLVAKGVRVLSVDLRGHGQSQRSGELGDAVYPAMLHDARAALKALRRYELKTISLIGGDIGANLALNLAAETPAVTRVVLLSPGFNIKGVKATQALTTFGDRPILLAAADGDDYAKKTATYLKGKATGPSALVVVTGDEKGAKLLEDHPNLEDAVLQWLDGNYGNAQLEQPDKAILTGAVDKMESVGKSFGE